MHSWWKTQDFSKIESGPNYTTAAHAFVKATLRLGLRAPFVVVRFMKGVFERPGGGGGVLPYIQEPLILIQAQIKS